MCVAVSFSLDLVVLCVLFVFFLKFNRPLYRPSAHGISERKNCNFSINICFINHFRFSQECPEGVVHEECFKDIYAKFFPHGSKYYNWAKTLFSLSYVSTSFVLYLFSFFFLVPFSIFFDLEKFLEKIPQCNNVECLCMCMFIQGER